MQRVRLTWPSGPTVALGGILVLALTLRIWSNGHGLPLVYNPDELAHYVPTAVKFFQNGYDPQQYFNPPGLSYLLHVIFAAWFGGENGVTEAWATRPSDVYLVARYVSAVLGTLAVLLTYLAARRLFDRITGLFAAALLAVAFLPVFYSHQAVNDGPQLAPITLSLFGTAGILTRGNRIDYVLAGAGLGLASGTKYTAGIVILPLLAAGLSRFARPDERRRAAVGMGISAVAAAVGFVLTVPGIVFDTGGVLEDLRDLSPEGEPKLGQAEESGIRYYLWTMTWGLGWIPTLAALLGAVALARSDRRLALVLVPAPAAFILFMGLQDRYFGRWLLPILPIVCVLSAYGVLMLSRSLSQRAPRRALALTAVAALALTLEGLVHSVHSDLVLSRKSTHAVTRDWMVASIPPGALVVIEPNTLRATLDDRLSGPAEPFALELPPRWQELDLRRGLRQLVRTGRLSADELPNGRVPRRRISSERYATYLRPELIDEYVRSGACWVVAGSSQWGRAFAEPDEVPGAIEYYRALAQRGQVVYSALPYERAQDPEEFDFDWSSNYYPLRFDRPGPEINVYRLTGGRC